MKSHQIKPSGSSSIGLSGHAKQDAKELLEDLGSTKNPGACLVPAPGSANGVRFMKLGHSQISNGMMINEGKHNSPAPGAALLQALKSKDTRTVLIPQVYSEAAQRNVRFAVLLPAGYDADRPDKYDIVGLRPEHPPGKTLAKELAEGDLTAKAQELLDAQGVSDAIVVVPERFEHHTHGAKDSELDKLADAVISEDIAPWISNSFNAESEVIASFATPGTESTSGDEVQVVSKFGGDFSSSSHKESGGFFSAKSSLVADLIKTPNAVLVDKASGHSVTGSSGLGKALSNLGNEGLPKRYQLAKLDKSKQATVMVSSIGSSVVDRDVAYSVIVPPGFDVDRKAPYNVQIAIPPVGAKAKDVISKLASGDGVDTTDTIVVVPHVPSSPKTSGSAHFARSEAVAQGELLAIVQDALPVDLSKVTQTKLGSTPSAWQSQAAELGSPIKLAAPIVSEGKKWVQLAPTTNYRRAFPDVKSWGKTEQIPKSFQKQGATQGTLFAPAIDSECLGERVRAGVYLPPGYDPASAETYPVLVMLPGQGNPLHYWTSAGQLNPKLDAMMQGDAQKMIVVVAPNTDSFWYDYEEHGDGDFAKKDKGQFEGHIDELIDYATQSLKGDPKRLSIGGISRGGFGAMSIAGRNPGKFQSVSAHAALMALEHDGGELGGQATTLAKQGHFGDRGDPCWAALNPADLAQSGAFDGPKAPKIFVDCGNEDPISRDHALIMADLLDQRGVDHTFMMQASKDGELKHNWNTWTPMLETWIGFHQKTYGTPGKAALPSELKDVGQTALAAHRKDVKAQWADIEQTRLSISAEAKKAPGAVAKLLPQLTDVRPYERIYGAAGRLEKSVDELATQASRAQALLTPEAGSLHAAKIAQSELRSRVRDLVELRSDVENGLAQRFIGKAEEHPKTKPGAFASLGPADRARLESVAAAVPESKAALQRLVSLRPELFSGPDSLTKKPFAAHLDQFIKDGALKKSDVDGFVEFIDRIATKRFDWRRGGYSHSVCAAMNTVFNHPGIILGLIQAARDGNSYKVGGVYSGDGSRKLKPHEDFKAGFKSVDSTASLPGAALGYERGFLRAIVDELSPSAHSLPDDRFAKRADPVAVSLSKLTGETVRYGYAFGLKSGEDLVAAVESQNGEGLAMADVQIRIGDGAWHHLHFPVFYDYDAKTETISMQEWSRPPQRIAVDDLEFFVDKGKKEGPAIYYRESDDIDQFLTPELQSNWDKIRPDKPSKSSWLSWDWD